MKSGSQGGYSLAPYEMMPSNKHISDSVCSIAVTDFGSHSGSHEGKSPIRRSKVSSKSDSRRKSIEVGQDIVAKKNSRLSLALRGRSFADVMQKELPSARYAAEAALISMVATTKDVDHKMLRSFIQQPYCDGSRASISMIYRRSKKESMLSSNRLGTIYNVEDRALIDDQILLHLEEIGLREVGASFGSP